MQIFPYHLSPCRVNKFTRRQLSRINIAPWNSFPLQSLHTATSLKNAHSLSYCVWFTDHVITVSILKLGMQFHMCKEPTTHGFIYMGKLTDMNLQAVSWDSQVNSQACSSFILQYMCLRHQVGISSRHWDIHELLWFLMYFTYKQRCYFIILHTFYCYTGIITWHTDSSYQRGTLHSVVATKKAPLHSCNKVFLDIFLIRNNPEL